MRLILIKFSIPNQSQFYSWYLTGAQRLLEYFNLVIVFGIQLYCFTAYNMHEEKLKTPSFWEHTRFFAPLALQAASQGLTYPLVSMVASRGPGGPLNLAGLAQANTVMFMLGTTGFGLIATGMVYARDRGGFDVFRSVTFRLALVVITLQAILGMDLPAHILFDRLIGLPPTIAQPAQTTLLAMTPLQICFFWRIPDQVAMYNRHWTTRASSATILRIFMTAALAPVFCMLGWVGPIWAVVCLTFPVGLEVLLSRWLAEPALKELSGAVDPLPSRKQLFFFNLPLSLSGYLLTVSSIIVGAFIARAPEPERILPVYYLALGLATPAAFGAARLQEVVLAFGAKQNMPGKLLRFALFAGTVLGVIPLLFILPGLDEFYYVRLQNLAYDDLRLVHLTAISLAAFPLCAAIRAQGEGLAGLARKTVVVTCGQVAYLLMVLVTGSLALLLGVRGMYIGSLSLCLGNLSSTILMRLLLKRAHGSNLLSIRTSAASSRLSPIK